MSKLLYNPQKVAQLEVAWWKAHHAKDKRLMFEGLVAQHMEMYGLTKEEALSIVNHFVTGIKFHDTREWDLATEAVQKAYEVIKRVLQLNFETKKAAALEIGWWQLHDKLEFVEDKTPLAQNFADLYATVFSLESAELIEAGKMKAEATRQHDLAEAEGAKEDEIERCWTRAEECLAEFYGILKNKVNK